MVQLVKMVESFKIILLNYMVQLLKMVQRVTLVKLVKTIQPDTMN